MPLLVQIIGIWIVAMGALFLLRPALLKQYIAFLTKGKKLYLAGISRAIIGAILISASTECRFSLFVYILGILAMLKAALIFILGMEKAKKMLGWWERKPAQLIRLWGVLAITIGLLLVYSA